jgi:hypothetical protein
MILLGLDFGGVLFPWDSAKVVALLVVGGIMIFAFVYSEKRLAKYPLIPMALFKRRTNVAAFSLVFFHGFVSRIIYSRRTTHANGAGIYRGRVLCVAYAYERLVEDVLTCPNRYATLPSIRS